MWKLHHNVNVWHVLECLNSWINAEEMLITCQAAHNEHAFNKTGRLTDCNSMTDYTVAYYKSKKRDIALHSVQNTHPLYFWMNRLYIEQMRVMKLPSRSGNVPAPLLLLGYVPIPLVCTSNQNITGFQASILLTEQLLPVDYFPDQESSLGCLLDQGTLTNLQQKTGITDHIE